MILETDQAINDAVVDLMRKLPKIEQVMAIEPL